MVKRLGQITVKKIGSSYAACISGTPKKIFNSRARAEEEVIRLRRKFGRRHYTRKKK